MAPLCSPRSSLSRQCFRLSVRLLRLLPDSENQSGVVATALPPGGSNFLPQNIFVTGATVTQRRQLLGSLWNACGFY